MAMRNLPTLKGVFPQPKAPPKRDFLRENKLKLKDLQKLTTKRNSQCETDNSSDKHFGLQRHRSETRASSVARRINSGCSCSSKKTQSSINSTKQFPKPVHCDKSIQTDEINDEVFLSDALKRCFSNNDVHLKQHSNRDLSEKYASSERIHARYNSTENIPNNKKEDNDLPDSDALNIDFNNYTNEEDRLSTMQSVQHEPTKKKQHRIVGAPDIGIRTDIKLPKYLEKEKRERELQRIREMERDSHCPKGHYVLDDRERQEALKLAEKRFQDLVNELNRMPMSGETLRIRNRKMEIEKALIELENNIRTFSKAKVYVKCEN